MLKIVNLFRLESLEKRRLMQSPFDWVGEASSIDNTGTFLYDLFGWNGNPNTSVSLPGAYSSGNGYTAETSASASESILTASAIVRHYETGNYDVPIASLRSDANRETTTDVSETTASFELIDDIGSTVFSSSNEIRGDALSEAEAYGRGTSAHSFLTGEKSAASGVFGTQSIFDTASHLGNYTTHGSTQDSSGGLSVGVGDSSVQSGTYFGVNGNTLSATGAGAFSTRSEVSPTDYSSNGSLSIGGGATGSLSTYQNVVYQGGTAQVAANSSIYGTNTGTGASFEGTTSTTVDTIGEIAQLNSSNSSNGPLANGGVSSNAEFTSTFSKFTTQSDTSSVGNSYAYATTDSGSALNKSIHAYTSTMNLGSHSKSSNAVSARNSPVANAEHEASASDNIEVSSYWGSAGINWSVVRSVAEQNAGQASAIMSTSRAYSVYEDVNMVWQQQGLERNMRTIGSNGEIGGFGIQMVWENGADTAAVHLIVQLDANGDGLRDTSTPAIFDGSLILNRTSATSATVAAIGWTPADYVVSVNNNRYTVDLADSSIAIPNGPANGKAWVTVTYSQVINRIVTLSEKTVYSSVSYLNA